MLIRTRRYKCYRIATVIRVFLVVGIPLVYLLFASDHSEQEILESSLGSGKDFYICVFVRDVCM